MYLFKSDLKEELLDGRKINFVASKMGISRQWLHKILNGEKTTTKENANKIISVCNQDHRLNYYFDNKKAKYGEKETKNI